MAPQILSNIELLSASSFDYPKLPPTLGSGEGRDGGQRRVQQIANRPNPIRNPKRHGWRAAQTLLNAAVIVERDMQRDGTLLPR